MAETAGSAITASVGLILLSALVLGLIHGVTPDEHTWPITFSYAISGFSSRRGMLAGIWFALAFTLQRALASELAYLSLGHWLEVGRSEPLVDAAVGVVMVLAGLYMVRQGHGWHLDLGALLTSRPSSRRSLPARMAATHGFLAGWAFGPFAIVIYSVLAPNMRSAWLGWMPGALFGIGTLLTQAVFGALLGGWVSRRLPGAKGNQLAQLIAIRTLLIGGSAFTLAGIAGVAFPVIDSWSVATGIDVYNLDQVNLGLVLVLFTVLFVGVGTILQVLRKSGVGPAEDGREPSPSVPVG